VRYSVQNARGTLAEYDDVDVDRALPYYVADLTTLRVVDR
jgi:hypothetical protein